MIDEVEEYIECCFYEAVHRSAEATWYATLAVDSMIQITSWGRFVRGLVLDTILGAEEDFEAVTTAAPPVVDPLAVSEAL